MSKRGKKKPVRGSGFSVSLPTENMAGAAKTSKVMSVQIQDEGQLVNAYDLPLGQVIEFRVGGTTQAVIKRSGPAPDTEIRIVADGDNKQTITVEYEHALESKLQTVDLQPGQKLTMNPVLARNWLVTAPNWE